MSFKDIATVIYGPPGTGKTTTLMGLMELALQRGISPQSIAFVTFTRAARMEAKRRAIRKFNLVETDLPWFRTLHSTGLKLLGHDREKIMTYKWWKIFSELYRYDLSFDMVDLDADELGKPPQFTDDDKLRFVYEWGRHRMLSVDKTLSFAPIAVRTDYFHGYVNDYLKFKRNNELIDFHDMLEQSIDIEGPPVSIAFIDEAQDLTPLQIAVATSWFKDCEEVLVAGDDDQCQPANTLITLNNGNVIPIDKLDPEKHKLLSYNKENNSICGKENGYNFKISYRPYYGLMANIEVSNRRTECTPQHRWLVRFNNNFINNELYITFLMRKGDRFRVGHCKHLNGVFHPIYYAEKEKADALWILKVSDSESKSYMYECIMSVRYGIPQIKFVSDDEIYSQDWIDDFWSFIHYSKDNAEKCLKDHHLLIDYPIWTSYRKHKKIGYGTFETQACNLISNIMSLPIRNGDNKVEWHPLNITWFRTNEYVYSLDVEEHHTYIANGIITRNSIYTWSGAEPDWLISLKKEVKDYEILDQSYRVPKLVHGMANRIIDRNSNRVIKKYNPNKYKGELKRGTRKEAIFEIGETISNHRNNVFILVRNRVFMKKWSSDLFNHFIPFTVEGRGESGPLGKPKLCKCAMSAKTLFDGGDITATEFRSLLDFIPASYENLIPRGTKKKAKDNKSNVSSDELSLYWGMNGFVDHIRNNGPCSILIKNVKEEIREYLQSLIDKKYDLIKIQKFPPVRITTIHGSKGREANLVIVVPDMAKASYKEYISNEESENRVAYVAVTRTKWVLFLVKPESRMYYPYEDFIVSRQNKEKIWDF